jgi:hypothetical protein
MNRRLRAHHRRDRRGAGKGRPAMDEVVERGARRRADQNARCARGELRYWWLPTARASQAQSPCPPREGMSAACRPAVWAGTDSQHSLRHIGMVAPVGERGVNDPSPGKPQRD